MNISKELLILQFTLILGITLQSEANSSTVGDFSLSGRGEPYQLESNTYYTDDMFSDLCFRSKQLAEGQNATGYFIETAGIPIHISNRPQFRAEVWITSKGGSIETEGDRCTEPDGDFCREPDADAVLYQDGLVRVIKKPRYNGRIGDLITPTDVLIVPLRHVRNTHALKQESPDDRALLNHIGSVAHQLAYCFNQEDAEYTLMTRNGQAQGVQHLHVHFKSNVDLDVQRVRSLPHNRVQQHNHVQQQRGAERSFFSRYRTVLSGLIALSVAAAAAISIYSWFKKGR